MFHLFNAGLRFFGSRLPAAPCRLRFVFPFPRPYPFEHFLVGQLGERLFGFLFPPPHQLVYVLVKLRKAVRKAIRLSAYPCYSARFLRRKFVSD